MDFLWQTDFVVRHTACLARNFKRWTGRELLPEMADAISPAVPSNELSRAVFEAPFVLVSHGTQPDPVLNYGNRSALTLWDMSWDEFTSTPSRLTAEAPNREERARLLEAVTNRGFIDEYSGVRISKTGRRFRIARATVWNLLTEDGTYCGQAALFSDWKFLQAQ